MTISGEFIVDGETTIRISEIASLYRKHIVTRYDNSWGAMKEMDGYEAVVCVLKSGEKIPIKERDIYRRGDCTFRQLRILTELGIEKYNEFLQLRKDCYRRSGLACLDYQKPFYGITTENMVRE
ncbi:MAG: hypothetical protein WC319_15425 [Candidatus Paceibacterota bacterium]|jgi:hypothetical protein